MILFVGMHSLIIMASCHWEEMGRGGGQGVGGGYMGMVGGGGGVLTTWRFRSGGMFLE